MRLVNVAVAALNQAPLDWENNKNNILHAIEHARKDGVSILCLPELCLCGYGCEDAFHSPSVARTSLELLREILPVTEGIIVSLGLPLFYQNALFNAACLAADGRVYGFVAKQFLAGGGIHYEPRWFRPWKEGASAEVPFDGRKLPVGDLVFDCGGVKVGFEICEDAWVANRTGSDLSLQGIDIILNPSASHFGFGRAEIRKRLVLEGSRAFGVSYLYANLLGNEAGRVIYDGGGMIASAGRLLAVGPRFSYRSHVVTSAQLDIDTTRMSQARSSRSEPAPTTETDRCIEVPFAFPELEPRLASPQWAPWEEGLHVKEEEFARAVALGLFDYLRRSRSRGFVISLSGGADSASVACLVALMVKLGVAELGGKGFLERLPGPPGAAPQAEVAELTRALLCCLYQATENSSETTRQAARGVAEALKAEFLEFDVDDLVGQYIDMVSRSLGRPLTWERDDVALQNIQARVRAPGAWLLANIKGALLLATSNRSEAAVGYATMDGDTCGGLSPIAGIDKAYLLKWLRWMEKTGPQGVGPLPALAAVNAQQPTAELRPPEEGQTDEGDLMPYEMLDAIERAAIRDKRTPTEVFQLMLAEFPEYDRPQKSPGDQVRAAVTIAPQHNWRQLALWVERFFRLWCRNQWKRERYAPSFHLDDENLDPKSWCRFPILSGGFERELAEMRAYLESLESQA